MARVVQISAVSRRNCGLGDVLPGGVRLGAELSICGGGQSVPTRAEVVGDSAEWDKEALRVLS
jgi:hypothetical protein